MKTAVSIPDPLFRSADRLAKQMKTSRSALYAAALREYLARRDAAMLARWAALCAKEADDPETQAWLRAGLEVLRRVEWTD